MRPSVNTNPVANQYTGDNERIVEFTDRTLQVGGLIAFRRTDDGRLLVQVYRQDKGVEVSYEGDAPPLSAHRAVLDACMREAWTNYEQNDALTEADIASDIVQRLYRVYDVIPLSDGTGGRLDKKD